MKRLLVLLVILTILSVGYSSIPQVELSVTSQRITPTQQVISPTSVNPIMLYNSENDKHCKRWVDSLMNRMTLKEKVGQLFIYTLAPIETKRNIALINEVVNTYKVGGLLFSGGKVQTQAALTNHAQRLAKIPLMVTFDGEWGLSMRLRGTPVFPRNMVLGCIQDNQLIYEYGREMARQCRLMGVQVNFAPVADVNINPQNPVINTRSFGENPVQVADKVTAYALGLESEGVLSVCKHFPGHGDTDTDSHKALPLLPFTRERLDSVELYPFKEAIRAGVSGMMVGHLQVPVFEPIGGLPSSLSRNVVYDLLTDNLGFKGLIFTDALAMKGVAGNVNVCLHALKAGNDMVLAPRDLKDELDAIMNAIEKGQLSQEDIEMKCRKVLTYKYALGLTRKPHIRLSGLDKRINNPQTRDLIRKLNLAAITVVGNQNHVLPLHSGKGEEVALLEVGDVGTMNPLANQITHYVPVKRFQLRPRLSEEEGRLLRDSLNAYKRILVAVSEQRLASYQNFFATFVPKHPVVYLFFTPGKMMLQIQRAVSQASAVVLGHTPIEEVQQQVADVLFAEATADGRLPATLGGLFQSGDGVTITPHTPLHFIPDEYGLSTAVLERIDSIALDGIRQGAYPGCQVVVMKDGHVMMDKSFGTHTGKGSARVESTDIYDLASLSKTTGTVLALMKLYDKGRYNLTDKVSDYLPFLQHTNKKNITIQELLFHQSGLPSGISFYPETIDKSSYRDKLFASQKDNQHPLQLGPGTWANPNFKFVSQWVSSVKTGEYVWQVCDSVWLNRDFRKVIEKKIADASVGAKKYLYSDVGFILLRMVVEQLAGMPMDVYLQKEFYEPMGLERTGYLPLRRHKKADIVPSNADNFLRKATLQGFVHDEAAAFQGGISGNAGLFSTAREVALVYQMLLNGGEWEGHSYLSRETCDVFTTSVSKLSRRGLGFDKPDTTRPDSSPCAPSAPESVYGHTGFTGTCAWVDPDNGLIYVFLSNRIYPDANNRKLSQLNIREKIQEVIYEALKK